MKDAIQACMDIIEESAFGRQRYSCLEKAIPPLIAYYGSFGLPGVKIGHRFLETLREDIRGLPDHSSQKSSLEFLDQCSKFLLPKPDHQRPGEEKY